ncbi:hypothetical protein J4418_00455 [Candidatus Woesearchaeota archaeon]|nr:hypothetical protein [Candidatus Woesearchaeota archaeon]
MVKPQIISEIPISMCEVKFKLDIIKTRDGELNFRSTRTNDYLNQVGCILDSKKAEELKKKIEGLEIPRLKPEHLIKIIDILPVTEDHLKMILSGYILTISQANIKKIVELIKEFAPN